MTRASSSRDRGASSVVGIVMLVGVVVILGSIVAAFAFDLGQEVQDVGPKSSMEFTYTDGAGGSADCGSGGDALHVEFASGDTLETSQVSVSGSSVSGANVGFDDPCTGLGSEMTAGDGFSVAVQDADSVRIVWQGPDSTSVVSKWDGPEA